MLKLMKYEFRRQLFSKVVILGGLLALVAAFFGFYWNGAWKGTTMVLALMSLGTIVVVFFAPFEYLVTFDKDINTKQGYMLLLVPEKSTTILSAKLLVSLLQSVVIYALFFSVVPFCEQLAKERFFGFISDGISEMVNELFSGISSVGETVIFWVMLFMLWMFFSCLGLFVTAIPRQGKMASLFGFVGFVAAIFVVSFLLDKIAALFNWLKTPELIGDIFEWVYMLGIDVALFFGTAKLLDKKVSI